jgi:group I intron endonuclease
MWLYKLTNLIADKGYIGTSVNPVSQRISRHLYAAKSGRENMPIAYAIKKYGIKNFSIETLVQCDDYDYLLDLEAKAIVRFNTRSPNGYNLTAGGRGTRRPCSPETRSLISSRTKGRIPWNFGKRSEATELRYARRGKTSGHRKGTPAWNSGKKLGPLPEEQRKNVAEAVRRVRAIKFWSSRKKESNPTAGGI